MSVSSTGLHGSATIVNSDLLNDVNPQVRPRANQCRLHKNTETLREGPLTQGTNCC
jgi:hypothetical protein